MTAQHVVDVRPHDNAEPLKGGRVSHYWVECNGCTWWAVIAGHDNALQRASAHTAAHETAA